MDSLRRPVGTLPPAVYWRRRALVLVVLLAILAVILYACSGSTAKKNTAGPTKPTAAASAGASTPTGAAAAVGGTGTGSGGELPSGSTPSGTSTASVAPGGAVGGLGGANGSVGPGGTASPGSPTGTAAAPGTCQLALALTAGAPAYANGDKPSFTVAVVNKGTADCTVDLGGKSLVLTVFSGTERIWSTADCSDGTPDLRAIAAGGIQQIPVSWPRVHSTAGCSGNAVPAGLGTYYAQATLSTGPGASPVSFTSPQQSFQLKTGS